MAKTPKYKSMTEQDFTQAENSSQSQSKEEQTLTDYIKVLSNIKDALESINDKLDLVAVPKRKLW